MEWSRDQRGLRTTRCAFGVAGLIIGVALAVAACTPDDRPNVAAEQPRGATVSFESIDGPPRALFRTLVEDLNNEAQARRLAVIARERPSAYRVRGYLAATVEHRKTIISWVWDVFDRDEHRALRISGSETAKAGQGRGWQAADNAMLQRIAHTSMSELSAFLTSPAVAPGTPDTAAPQVAFAAPDVSTPEAAGIFRIFHPKADPVSTLAPAASKASPVPLPRRRPPPAIAVSTGETVTLAAASH